MLTKYSDIPHDTLKEYELLLNKWNSKINLVSESTLIDFEHRHIIDSIQITQYIDNKKDKIIDLGSGAGLPGMVLALIGYENVTLIESDIRKAAFLLQASRLIKNSPQPQIINKRIESLKDISCDIVISRAFAELNKIFDYTRNFSIKKKYLLHKGENYQKEIEAASQCWLFSVTIHDSLTLPKAKILEITDVKPKY
ncbi:MAG: 16S rRNA (guanine(527)-N(7))-methyltransferase RsmG [Rickettsiaceae bacterium]|nr:16S rRNA (guanine(527)-N(7))-methyltransferase RsmG [Rickettsiaceae bacterium]